MSGRGRSAGRTDKVRPGMSREGLTQERTAEQSIEDGEASAQQKNIFLVQQTLRSRQAA